MFTFRNFFRATVMTLAGCSSFDLGKKAPNSFAVNTTSPTWAADIRPVLAAKCANCHTNNKTQFVPSNVPSSSTLNNITDQTTFDETLALSVKRRVFDTPTNPMPPNFATPLSDDERLALQKYIEGNASSAIAKYCTSVSSTAKTYADISSTLASSCTSCHANGGEMASLPLTTLAQVKVQREIMLQVVSEKSMPPTTASAFHTSTDRTALIEWLCAGSDLN